METCLGTVTNEFRIENMSISKQFHQMLGHCRFADAICAVNPINHIGPPSLFFMLSPFRSVLYLLSTVLRLGKNTVLRPVSLLFLHP